MRTVVTQPTSTREQQIIDTITNRYLENGVIRHLENGEIRTLNGTYWQAQTQPTTSWDLV